MYRKKISFDVDGVIAQGGWVPVEDRNNKFYAKKEPLNTEVLPTLHWLAITYDIYIISTRGHANANLGLRGWLHWVLGLELDTIAGVVTYPGTAEEIAANPNAKMDKGKIVRDLGIVVHFDDDPIQVEGCGERGVLVPSEMPTSVAAKNVLPTAVDWETIRSFLTTPDMVLHGSNGMSVVSPAVVEKEYPKLELEKAIAIN